MHDFLDGVGQVEWLLVYGVGLVVFFCTYECLEALTGHLSGV